MNAFVDYLNSMHSIKGDSMGALAERQVQLPYSQHCHVPRRLGQIIAGQLREGQHRAYIITGHAGDGKTSILVQVLRELGMLKSGEALSSDKVCTSAYGKLYYVKDMSELPSRVRSEYLRRALNAPGEGMSSVLISNTGPLLASFEDVMREDCEKNNSAYEEIRQSVQTMLLEQLDTNAKEECEIGGYRFSMINIARIDNTSFAATFLDRILDTELWQDCATCEKRDKCPIHRNCEMLRDNLDRVKTFVKAFLRYTYEFDQRLTIRQIQAQLCFAITGGLNCRDVVSHRSFSPFKYGFPNLFFGYLGKDENTAALKLKAIRMLHDMDLDAVTLPVDYELFVKEQTDFFPSDVKQLICADILHPLKALNKRDDMDVKKRNGDMIALR